jgi:hypothetical protein
VTHVAPRLSDLPPLEDLVRDPVLPEVVRQEDPGRPPSHDDDVRHDAGPSFPSSFKSPSGVVYRLRLPPVPPRREVLTARRPVRNFRNVLPHMSLTAKG